MEQTKKVNGKEQEVILALILILTCVPLSLSEFLFTQCELMEKRKKSLENDASVQHKYPSVALRCILPADMGDTKPRSGIQTRGSDSQGSRLKGKKLQSSSQNHEES